MDANLEAGFLTEKNGKPSSTRLKTTAAVFLGFLLILGQAAITAIGYLKGVDTPPPAVASWDTLLLLFGYGGFTAAANKMAENRG